MICLDQPQLCPSPKPEAVDVFTDADSELVSRAQQGDSEAFGELVDRHSRRVYRTTIAILGNLEEAQDAMQDTFLKAFAHIGRFQRRSKFSTWLISIASNNALQRLRERKYSEDLCRDDEGTSYPRRQLRSSDADPEQLYSQGEQRRAIAEGLKKVPSKYRSVLLLRDIEQLTVEQAATALGLGVPALKARLYRARLMLREVLSSHFKIGVARVV